MKSFYSATIFSENFRFKLGELWRSPIRRLTVNGVHRIISECGHKKLDVAGFAPIPPRSCRVACKTSFLHLRDDLHIKPSNQRRSIDWPQQAEVMEQSRQRREMNFPPRIEQFTTCITIDAINLGPQSYSESSRSKTLVTCKNLFSLIRASSALWLQRYGNENSCLSTIRTKTWRDTPSAGLHIDVSVCFHRAALKSRNSRSQSSSRGFLSVRVWARLVRFFRAGSHVACKLCVCCE